MTEATSIYKKLIVYGLTAYAFVSELYWFANYPPAQGFESDFLLIFTFRLVLFMTLFMSLVGRLMEHLDLHTGLVAHDILFHLPRQAMYYVVTLILIIQILTAVF